MADVNRGNRPLSPHLTIYRPQMTSMSSIFVRVTGNGLIVGAVLVVWWLLAAATSAEAYAVADAVITSVIGKIVMILSLWALWYHLLGGLRHLYWDTTGRGLDVAVAERLGIYMIIGSLGLTVVTVLLI